MQTRLNESIKNTPLGQQADAILRSCVHCGFCNATCPTYQLLGDELDGPRGRIYLIKQMLETDAASEKTQLHLDRCLTCRACETTCPSGVEYGKLLDIGRAVIDNKVKRPFAERSLRRLLRLILPYPKRVRAALTMSPTLSWLLPKKLTAAIPSVQAVSARNNAQNAHTSAQHSRQILLLEGCVQAATRPNINAAAITLFDQLDISLKSISGSGCCGAVSHHLAAVEEGRDFMRRNIDAWWPTIENGAEAIITTASACSLMVKDYGELLHDDPDYAEKAAKISALCCDISEVLAAELLIETQKNKFSTIYIKDSKATRIAMHLPCTAQHGQSLGKSIQSILKSCGFKLTDVDDSHLCCGAAGTYTITQPVLSEQLHDNKLAALTAESPDFIVTANIGCLLHMEKAAPVPIIHWIELLAGNLMLTASTHKLHG